MNAAVQRTAARATRARREKVVIVTRKTVLEELIERFNTVGQARFYLEHAGQDFASIEALHAQYHAVLEQVRRLVPAGVKQQVIDRGFLPQFSFAPVDLIVVVGPDGLVVNTAKYLNGQPIVAVNPDPQRIDGVLLPYTVNTIGPALLASIYSEPSIKKISVAEAVLNDGQRLLAFNDLFIGSKSHVSARYHLQVGSESESQSSSGIIVSTGAGSTGWLKSVYAGATRVIEALGGQVVPPPDGGRFAWDAEHLVYAVREPWPSKSSAANLVYGTVTAKQPLVITSQMSTHGVIFSDGVEADYVEFNAGFTATIRVAEQKAHLVVPA